LSDEPRTVSPARREEDAAEVSLRPQTLDEFVGQQSSRENLAVFIAATRARGDALDHVLLHGPPGLGKTTLAQIVARELGVGFRATSGPVIQRAGDLEGDRQLRGERGGLDAVYHRRLHHSDHRCSDPRRWRVELDRN